MHKHQKAPNALQGVTFAKRVPPTLWKPVCAWSVVLHRTGGAA